MTRYINPVLGLTPKTNRGVYVYWGYGLDANLNDDYAQGRCSDKQLDSIRVTWPDDQKGILYVAVREEYAATLELDVSYGYFLFARSREYLIDETGVPRLYSVYRSTTEIESSVSVRINVLESEPELKSALTYWGLGSDLNPATAKSSQSLVDGMEIEWPIANHGEFIYFAAPLVKLRNFDISFEIEAANTVFNSMSLARLLVAGVSVPYLVFVLQFPQYDIVDGKVNLDLRATPRAGFETYYWGLGTTLDDVNDLSSSDAVIDGKEITFPTANGDSLHFAIPYEISANSLISFYSGPTHLAFTKTPITKVIGGIEIDYFLYVLNTPQFGAVTARIDVDDPFGVQGGLTRVLYGLGDVYNPDAIEVNSVFLDGYDFTWPTATNDRLFFAINALDGYDKDVAFQIGGVNVSLPSFVADLTTQEATGKYRVFMQNTPQTGAVSARVYIRGNGLPQKYAPVFPVWGRGTSIDMNTANILYKPVDGQKITWDNPNGSDIYIAIPVEFDENIELVIGAETITPIKMNQNVTIGGVTVPYSIYTTGSTYDHDVEATVNVL